MNLHPEEQLTESVCRQPWMTAPRSHNERASGDHATRARRFAWRTPPAKGSSRNLFGTSRCPTAVHARVPATAASDTARPRADQMGTRTRVVCEFPSRSDEKRRKALERGRYLRPTLLVNPRRSTRRADKVDQMVRRLCLPASGTLSSPLVSISST